MARGILAVGAHIGDMDLAAGPLLATHALAGDRVTMVALTPGERGHPRLPPAEYREQKVAEGRDFAAAIGGGFEVFDDQSDGFLGRDETVAARLADVVCRVRPDVVVAHWPRSVHTDHENASYLAVRARFLAALPGAGNGQHRAERVVYAENWEDAEAFTPTAYVPIPDAAFELWRRAISAQAFARGETYGFRYIDYYTAQLTMRGCLAGVPRACAVAEADADVPVVPGL